MKKIYTWRTWLVLIISLIITIIAALYVKVKVDRKDEAEFLYESKSIKSKIETKLHMYAIVLRSGAAFFASSDSVSREEWEAFIKQHDFDSNLPGIMGVGFSLKISKDNLNEHIRKIKSEGLPEYTVWPSSQREEYSSIIFIEPFSGRNKQTLGYDMMSEPVRREAMERARDLGVVSLSGKVNLIQEMGDVIQASNLIYMPVYKKGSSVNSVEERRTALKGWIYCSYRINDFMSGVLPSRNLKENLHIYDGLTTCADSLLFEFHYSQEHKTAKKVRFSLNSPINFNGHKWTLLFTQGKGNTFVNYLAVWLVLLGGFLIAILLFLLTQSLLNTKQKAQTIAEKLTAQLKENKQRLNTIIELSPVPILLTNVSDGKIVTINESLVKLVKAPISKIIGSKSLDLYFNIEDRNTLLRAVTKNGYVDNFEIKLKNFNGELFWASISVKLINLDNKQVLFSALYDITDRKKANEELIKYKNQLEEMVSERTKELTISEQKLRKTLNVISHYQLALDESSSVAITDSKGVIKHANDKFCQLSKYSRDQLVGNTHKIVNSGLHSKEFFADLWATITKGKIWRGEIRNRTKDGAFYWLDSTIIPFLDQNGKPYQYVGVRFDITRRKQIEADLIKAKETADSASRAKSEFLANMSHEIRTPMNAIIGFSELLSKSVKDNKQLAQVESIYSSGKNLLKIINDILDLSKIEAGKIDIVPAPLNLFDLLSEIKKIFALKVKEKGISLHFESEKAVENTLLLDEVRLRQILFNIIGNAVKFTDKGSVILTIENMRNKKNRENVDLTILVKDTGIGIPKDDQKHIFDPFNQQQGLNNIKYGGTGLGLSITKKLVKEMGGSITLESEINKGSTFRVDFPNVPVADRKATVKETIFDTSTIVFRPAIVLIVDNNKENRKLLVDLLEKSPLTIIEATDGKEAVDLAKKHIPNLILMDLIMPVMDGCLANEILKKEKDTKSIPIIAISATINSLEDKESINKLFDEYLLKPIDFKQLFDMLKKYLKYELVETDNHSKKDDYYLQVTRYKFSKEQIEKLPEFINALELDFMPKYEKVIKSQVINEIEKFGLDLHEFSGNSGFVFLEEYCQKIKTYVDNFDFEKLIETLKKFPKLVVKLKAEINDI